MSAAEQLKKLRKKGIHLGTDRVRNNVLLEKNSGVVKDPNIWHAFIVHNKRDMTRNEMLDYIMRFVQPFELVPLKFHTVDDHNHVFFARDCFDAIQKLCINSLRVSDMSIPIPQGKKKFLIECEIVLCYASVTEMRISVIERMKPIFYRLHYPGIKTIILDNFAENEGLLDYLPLYQPKILYFALNLASNFNPLCITLKNNGIQTLSTQDILWKCTNLIHLDLRNNQITDFSAFSSLRGMRLTEIELDGNPICSRVDEYTYVSELKEIFPSLQKIDGEVITVDGLPAIKKNYLCNVDGFTLVNSFIDIYFFRYDKNRKTLQDLYHPNALCSITASYKIGQVTSNDARLRPYQVNSRNILLTADVTRLSQVMIIGKQHIINKLCDLPAVEHDPYSFMVDLIFFSEDMIIVNICGVFREAAGSILNNDRYLGFSRTFTLSNNNGEFLISNDMLHVYNALSSQVYKSFKIACPSANSELPIAETAKDKDRTLEAFRVITGLTSDYAKKLLHFNHYSIMAAIKYFMEMYKIDRIPPHAFEEQK